MKIKTHFLCAFFCLSRPANDAFQRFLGVYTQDTVNGMSTEADYRALGDRMDILLKHCKS